MEKVFQTGTGAILYYEKNEKKFIGTNPATIFFALLMHAKAGEAIAMKLIKAIGELGGIKYAVEEKEIPKSENVFPFIASDDEYVLQGVSSPEDFDKEARAKLKNPTLYLPR